MPEGARGTQGTRGTRWGEEREKRVVLGLGVNDSVDANTSNIVLQDCARIGFVCCFLVIASINQLWKTPPTHPWQQ